MASGPGVARRFRRHWRGLRFTCLGAAHLDRVTRLDRPALRHRSNPVHGTLVRPGGVALNIACALARLGTQATLFCPPPPAAVDRHLARRGVRQRNIGRQHVECSYTAILDPAGELELGIADMSGYDTMDADLLPRSFPAPGSAALVLDAAFAPGLMQAAARMAQDRGIGVVGAATSPAKAPRLAGIRFDLLVCNEAEARALVGSGTPRQLAAKLQARTGGWVAVTMGSRGACLDTGDGTARAQPPFGAVRDTTGAGDVFTATLAAAQAVVDLGHGTPAEALALAVEAGCRQATA